MCLLILILLAGQRTPAYVCVLIVDDGASRARKKKDVSRPSQSKRWSFPQGVVGHQDLLGPIAAPGKKADDQLRKKSKLLAKKKANSDGVSTEEKV